MRVPNKLQYFGSLISQMSFGLFCSIVSVLGPVEIAQVSVQQWWKTLQYIHASVLWCQLKFRSCGGNVNFGLVALKYFGLHWCFNSLKVQIILHFNFIEFPHCNTTNSSVKFQNLYLCNSCWAKSTLLYIVVSHCKWVDMSLFSEADLLTIDLKADCKETWWRKILT